MNMTIIGFKKNISDYIFKITDYITCNDFNLVTGFGSAVFPPKADGVYLY